MLHLPFQPDQWVDCEEAMFRACFCLLGTFVEHELGPPNEDWAEYRGYRVHRFRGCDDEVEDRSGEKAIDLWLWYRDELPELERDYNQDMEEVFSVSSREEVRDGMVHIVGGEPTREPKYPHGWPGTVKDRKLRELIDLRRALWT